MWGSNLGPQIPTHVRLPPDHRPMLCISVFNLLNIHRLDSILLSYKGVHLTNIN
uniref:Uncharacterized protein n=1 Tax=Solanum lycopersicum TaxID=4081 RepID=A0A3Q7FJG9_SOLLC